MLVHSIMSSIYLILFVAIVVMVFFITPAAAKY